MVGGSYYLGRGVLKDLTAAHIWTNISSANGNENSAEMRDTIEKEMTRKQIAEAMKRAKICMSSDYQDCD